MQVIITHTNADFDAIASILAAKKLYPQAIACYTGGVDRNVKEFMSLHKGLIDIKSPKTVPLEKIKTIIVVDTRIAQRLGDFKELVGKPSIGLHIYDHHPASDKDLHGDLEFSEECGATATILLRFIKERNLALTPLEATILALGIYEDTGSLTFSTTTPKDIEAAAYLLSQGANLAVVSGFINRGLTDKQKAVLDKLMNSIHYYNIKGVDIAIASTQVSGFVEEIATMVRKLADIEGVDAVFVLAYTPKVVRIVARSETDCVDVGMILGRLGGGGHHRAAATNIQGIGPQEAEERLLNEIKELVQPKIMAKDIMSYPVKTIMPDTTIEQAGKVMLRYGHSGLFVVGNGQLLGIISRRNVDKAKHHGYGKTPVSNHMTKELIIATPHTPIEELQNLLIQHDIGRLPVIENGKLVGVVTRTDILRALYGQVQSGHYTTYRGTGKGVEDVKKIITQQLPEKIQELLKAIGRIADEQGLSVFVVGGFVRDLLLGVPNFDVDILVEGDGITFGEVLAAKFKAQLKAHRKFGTALLVLPNGFKMDIASARREFYEYPAALPQVEVSCVRDDLYRRDFTINAMAIQLNEGQFGNLIDFFGGLKDLREGVVRVLHNLSFIEDPTRIFRAIRFEQRYNFKMDKQTQEFLINALDTDLLGKLTTDRVKDELILIFNEHDPLPAIKRLDELDILKYIHPSAKIDSAILDELAQTQEALKWFKELNLPDKYQPWLVYYLILFNKLSSKELRLLSQKFKLSQKQLELVTLVSENLVDVLKIIKRKHLKPSQIYRALEPLPVEALLVLVAKSKSEVVKERGTLYLKQLRYVQPLLKGDDLIKLGYAPGPAFKHVIEALKAAKLDGKVKTADDEMEFVRSYFNPDLALS